MGQNAMTDEDKDRRRRELLDAAHRLFRERGDLPPVAEIARAAGLAKGTVYLYFRSKEEIFVALLEDDFSRLFETLAALIAELPEAPGQAARRFAHAYSAAILARPDLLRLASLANGILEQNIPAEVMRRFKTSLANSLVDVGQQLGERFASLGQERGTTLLLQTYALTLGLWQALDYPQVLREMLNETALRPLDRHFASELDEAVETLWLGALSRACRT
jgi:AcrR family transcriptional regulator